MDDFTFDKMSGTYDVYRNDKLNGFLIVKHIEDKESVNDQFELMISDIIDQRVPQV